MQKRGDPNPIINCKKNIFMQRSVSADVTLEAGEYLVFLKIEASHTSYATVEEVVRENVKIRGAKLLRVALNHDLAHSKVHYEVEIEEKAARKRARQELSSLKKEVKNNLMKDKRRKKHLENKEKRKKRAAKAKKGAKAKAKATKEAEEKAKKASEVDKIDAACQTLEPLQPKPEESLAPQIEASSATDPVLYPTLPTLSAGSSIIITAPTADEDDDDSDLDSDVSDVSSGELEEALEARKSEYAFEKKEKALLRRNNPAPAKARDRLEQGGWNAVVIVGLRVYSKESGVSIKVVRPDEKIAGFKKKKAKRSKKDEEASRNKKRMREGEIPDGEVAMLERAAKEALTLIGDEESEEQSDEESNEESEEE